MTVYQPQKPRLYQPQDPRLRGFAQAHPMLYAGLVCLLLPAAIAAVIIGCTNDGGRETTPEPEPTRATAPTRAPTPCFKKGDKYTIFTDHAGGGIFDEYCDGRLVKVQLKPGDFKQLWEVQDQAGVELLRDLPNP